jgi:hypothetical protein
MDISEAFSILKFLLPLIAALVLFRFGNRIQHPVFRFFVKSACSLLAFASAAVILIVSVVSVGCSRHAHPMYSPDHRHVAILTYALQGALGDDYATVAVRSRWTPWATEAYSGLGAWDFKHEKPWDPEVRWLDSSHLLIRYFDYRAGTTGRSTRTTCRTQIGTVQVVCEQLPPHSAAIRNAAPYGLRSDTRGYRKMSKPIWPYPPIIARRRFGSVSRRSNSPRVAGRDRYTAIPISPFQVASRPV